MGWATLFTFGCAAPGAERAPDREPERTLLGQRDERPRPTLTSVRSAPPTSCAVGSSPVTGAQLAELSLFSRTLFYLRETYPRDITPYSRQLLLAALSAIPAADQDVAVERDPDALPRWINVTVAGERCALNIERVDAPWNLRSSLQTAMRFIGSRLALPAGETEARFTRIELAATNGMLAALDRASMLTDAPSYERDRGKPAGLIASALVSPQGQAAARPQFQGPYLEDAAYLPVGGFARGAAAEVEQGAAGSGERPPKGVILDLRNDKGGLVDEAAKVAGVFIQRGVLGWIVGRHERTALEAHDSGHDFTGTVVVLVNHETASAAELVASAIQSLGRGLIIGEVTAGAGSVRTFFALPRKWRPAGASSPPAPPDRDVVQNILDGVEPPPPQEQAEPFDGQPDEMFELLLRTGYLRTANDREIEGAGVLPDIQIPRPVGPTSAAGDACLIHLAQALISQAPDARRSTLLPIAKTLADRWDCGQAP